MPYPLGLFQFGGGASSLWKHPSRIGIGQMLGHGEELIQARHGARGDGCDSFGKGHHFDSLLMYGDMALEPERFGGGAEKGSALLTRLDEMDGSLDTAGKNQSRKTRSGSDVDQRTGCQQGEELKGILDMAGFEMRDR